MLHILRVLLLSFFLLSCEQHIPPTPVQDIPNRPLVDSRGQPWRFADYRGQWIIVNYWASWCKPCLTELPELEAFYQLHKDHAAVVVGVNYDFVSVSATRKLAEQHAVTYPILPSESDPALHMGIEPIMVLPTTLIVNPQGYVVAKLLGEQTQQTLTQVITR